MTELVYSSKSEKVQALKRTKSIKVKSLSTGCFCAKITEPFLHGRVYLSVLCLVTSCYVFISFLSYLCLATSFTLLSSCHFRYVVFVYIIFV